MFGKKFVIYITLLITIISGVVAAVVYPTASFVYDVAMACFGSAFLGCIMTFLEYFAVPRSTMELFMEETRKVAAAFSKVPIVAFSAPRKLVLNALAEEWANASVLFAESEKKCDAKNALIEWLKPFYQSDMSEVISQEELDKDYQQLITDAKSSIEKSAKAYIALRDYDTNPLSDAYGALDFVLGNKYRQKVYEGIYKPLADVDKKICRESYHFQEYFKARNGNLPVITDKVLEVQDQIFEAKESDSDAYWNIYVYKKFLFCVSMNLDEFWNKTYFKHEKVSMRYSDSIVNIPVRRRRLSGNPGSRSPAEWEA